MFIIDIIYKVSLEEINKCMPPHVEHLEKYFASGNFLIAGRKNPWDGGIIIALASSRDNIENIVHQDPFYTNNLADFKITEFSGGRRVKNIDELLANTQK